MKKYIYTLALALACLLILSGCAIRQSDIDTNDETTIELDTTDNKETEAEDIPPVPFLLDGKTVICLDAGHGFRDTGCDTDLLNGIEAETNLAVTLMLKRELENRGATVILTHDGETYPSANEIIAIANDAGIDYDPEKIIDNDIFSAGERAIYTSAIAEENRIDLFISLHVNSLEGHPEVSRYELDYFEGNPDADFLALFCETLQGKLEKKTVIFCDDAENAFAVTKPLTHPSVLIEMGYATSPVDAGDLNSDEWRAQFVKNVADSVMESIEEYNAKN